MEGPLGTLSQGVERRRPDFRKEQGFVDAGSLEAVAQTVGALAAVALDRRSVPARLFEEGSGSPQVLEGLGPKCRDGSRRRQLGLRNRRVGTDDQPPGPEPCDDVDAHRFQLGQAEVPRRPQAAGQPRILATYGIDGRVCFGVGSRNREHQ